MLTPQQLLLFLHNIPMSKDNHSQVMKGKKNILILVYFTVPMSKNNHSQVIMGEKKFKEVL